MSLYQLLKTGTLCTRVQHSSWCTSYWTTPLKQPPLEEICCCSEKISGLTCKEPWPCLPQVHGARCRLGYGMELPESRGKWQTGEALSSASADIFSHRDAAFAAHEILTRQNSEEQEPQRALPCGFCTSQAIFARKKYCSLNLNLSHFKVCNKFHIFIVTIERYVIDNFISKFETYC